MLTFKFYCMEEKTVETLFKLFIQNIMRVSKWWVLYFFLNCPFNVIAFSVNRSEFYLSDSTLSLDKYFFFNLIIGLSRYQFFTTQLLAKRSQVIKVLSESESEGALLARYVWMCLHIRGICYSDRSSTVQQNDSNRTGHRQQKNNIQIYK